MCSLSLRHTFASAEVLKACMCCFLRDVPVFPLMRKKLTFGLYWKSSCMTDRCTSVVFDRSLAMDCYVFSFGATAVHF